MPDTTHTLEILARIRDEASGALKRLGTEGRKAGDELERAGTRGSQGLDRLGNSAKISGEKLSRMVGTAAGGLLMLAGTAEGVGNTIGGSLTRAFGGFISSGGGVGGLIVGGLSLAADAVRLLGQNAGGAATEFTRLGQEAVAASERAEKASREAGDRLRQSGLRQRSRDEGVPLADLQAQEAQRKARTAAAEEYDQAQEAVERTQQKLEEARARKARLDALPTREKALLSGSGEDPQARITELEGLLAQQTEVQRKASLALAKLDQAAKQEERQRQADHEKAVEDAESASMQRRLDAAREFLDKRKADLEKRRLSETEMQDREDERSARARLADDKAGAAETRALSEAEARRASVFSEYLADQTRSLGLRREDVALSTELRILDEARAAGRTSEVAAMERLINLKRASLSLADAETDLERKRAATAAARDRLSSAQDRGGDGPAPSAGGAFLSVRGQAMGAGWEGGSWMGPLASRRAAARDRRRLGAFSRHAKNLAAEDRESMGFRVTDEGDNFRALDQPSSEWGMVKGEWKHRTLQASAFRPDASPQAAVKGGGSELEASRALTQRIAEEAAAELKAASAAEEKQSAAARLQKEAAEALAGKADETATAGTDAAASLQDVASVFDRVLKAVSDTAGAAGAVLARVTKLEEAQQQLLKSIGGGY